MKAWIFQDQKMVAKHGKDKAAHYVGWTDPHGKRKCKSCGPGKDGRDKAKSLARKIDRELATGTYDDSGKVTWDEFVSEYRTKVLDHMKPNSASSRETALRHFRRLIRPIFVKSINTKSIDSYIAARRKERDGISLGTVNRELRELRATVRKAVKWGYLPNCPDFAFQKEKVKLITFIDDVSFGKLFVACDTMTEPSNLPFPAADWWKALLVTSYMTGWRIGNLLALRWRHVNLDAGTMLSEAEHNKGGRDLLISIEPEVIEQLRKIEGFGPALIFPIATKRKLYNNFHLLQDRAEVRREDGGYYGWHDCRRAFATNNFDLIPQKVLQARMQHKHPGTTDRYIRAAAEVRPSKHAMFVPACLSLPKPANVG